MSLERLRGRPPGTGAAPPAPCPCLNLAGALVMFGTRYISLAPWREGASSQRVVSSARLAAERSCALAPARAAETRRGNNKARVAPLSVPSA